MPIGLFAFVAACASVGVPRARSISQRCCPGLFRATDNSDPGPSTCRHAAPLSPDQERVVTVSWSQKATTRIWSLSSGVLLGKQEADITAGSGYINVLNDSGVIEGLEWAQWTVSIDHTGEKIVTAAGDGAARIWEIGPYGRPLVSAAEALLAHEHQQPALKDRMAVWNLTPH
jgi:hypothetical protein